MRMSSEAKPIVHAPLRGSLKVIVDARMLRSGGIGRYLREIVGRWVGGGGEDSGPEALTLRLLGHPGELKEWLGGLPAPPANARRPPARIEMIPWTDPIYSPRAHLSWLRHGARWTRGAHATLFPHWDAPSPPSGPPRVTTVHDLTQFLEPEGFPRLKRAVGERILRRAVDRAASILTVSEASRADLARWFPGASGRITVIPNGVDSGVFHPTTIADPGWTKLQPYILIVGPFKPHKGYRTALDVLRRLRPSHPELRLVQVGPPHIRDPGVAELLQDPDIGPRVIQRPFTDDFDLNHGYRHSLCLLHPARREGFGLPPLEAMAAGTPVLAAHTSSLPEVVGGGGILLDPDDSEEWARMVERLLTDPDVREEWIARGRERATCFSWDRTAARTLEVVQGSAIRC